MNEWYWVQDSTTDLVKIYFSMKSFQIHSFLRTRPNLQKNSSVFIHNIKVTKLSCLYLKTVQKAILHLWIKFTEWKVLFQTSSIREMYRDRVWQFLKKVQSIPPWPERQVEVLAQVEDVEWQPAHNEEEQGGQQHVGPPHIAPLTQHPSAQDNQGYWGYRGFYQNWQARVQVNSDKVK